MPDNVGLGKRSSGGSPSRVSLSLVASGESLVTRKAEPCPESVPGVDGQVIVRFVHRLRHTIDVFRPDNPVLADLVGASDSLPARTLFFVDDALVSDGLNLRGSIEAYARAHSEVMTLAGPIQTVVGGERCKNSAEVLDACLRAIDEAPLCRQSFVIAVGGGAVLDAVGYAAGISHRGIRLIRIPTTTLSQADSGVGVKNGVNAFGKKNYLGCFNVPWAVINDKNFLATLSARDWRCGFSEAVKVSVLKDRELFETIAANAGRIRERDYSVAAPILMRSAELHLKHIIEGGDPFEMSTARPLDFGHWSAHKLEQMTGFRMRHGEAVAIGLAIDVLYASHVDLLDRQVAERVLDCLEGLGFVLYDEALEDRDGLLRGIEEFRQHLGGRLTITLARGLGRPVDVHEMHADQVDAALECLARRAGIAPTSRPLRG